MIFSIRLTFAHLVFNPVCACLAYGLALSMRCVVAVAAQETQPAQPSDLHHQTLEQMSSEDLVVRFPIESRIPDMSSAGTAFHVLPIRGGTGPMSALAVVASGSSSRDLTLN